MRGRDDAGLRVKNLADPVHGAGGLLNLAPDFAQSAHRTGGQHRQYGELQQGPAGHGARDHRVSAQPEHRRHAAEHQRDHHGRHQRPRADPRERGGEGRLHRLTEPGGRARFPAERLDGVHRIDGLAGIGDGVGEPALGGDREPAHPPAEEEQGHDDHRPQQHDI